jgi:hypothetical protein
MADNKAKRGGNDRALIAMKEPYEVRYWSKKFKVTPEQLGDAVKKVGHSSKKVEAYLKEKKHKERDKMLIAMKEPYEVRYWSKKFKVTAEKLGEAVKAVGHSSRKVGEYLGFTTAKKSKKKAAKKSPVKKKKTAKKKAAKKKMAKKKG